MDRLYHDTDKVVILDDGDFYRHQISKLKFNGPGILKAYAPWCPHCRNKSDSIRALAEMMDEYDHDKTIYVFDADDNKITAKFLGISSFPSWFIVDEDGQVGKELDVVQFEDILEVLDLV